jgi:hypothetical protein
MKCSPDITGQIGVILPGVAVLGLATRANLWMYWLSEFLGIWRTLAIPELGHSANPADVATRYEA